LIATPYVMDEVQRNLPNLPPAAAETRESLRPALILTTDILTLDRPVIFGASKDRPILFSALAWADVLLTLDRNDFGPPFDKTFYVLRVMKPGTFLEQERTAGPLNSNEK